MIFFSGLHVADSGSEFGVLLWIESRSSPGFLLNLLVERASQFLLHWEDCVLDKRGPVMPSADGL